LHSAWGAVPASALSGGTAGLDLALRATGVEEGNEVITSPFPVRRFRQRPSCVAAPRLCSRISPRSRSISTGATEAAITPRTKAIVPVHIFGHPMTYAGAQSSASQASSTIANLCLPRLADMPAFERTLNADELDVTQVRMQLADRF
jgi:dTDP-4-amino-4,6-dideoxygalactose transaminase